MNREKLMRLAEHVFKRTEAYQENRGDDVPDEENYKMDFLLLKGSKNVPEDVLACASFADLVLLFHPLQENEQPIAQCSVLFTCDADFFMYLENGYTLVSADPDFHYCAWIEIGEEQGYVEHTDGMQKYLDYCKQHGITKGRLAAETGYDGMDVMTFYDCQAAKRSLGKRSQELER